MSINNRKEPFRYTLKEPIHFEIYILSINGVNAPAKPIQAELCDISRSGCQLSFPLSLPVENNDIRIGMNMLLFEDPLYMEGTLRWGQEKIPHGTMGFNSKCRMGTRTASLERCECLQDKAKSL